LISHATCHQQAVVHAVSVQEAPDDLRLLAAAAVGEPAAIERLLDEIAPVVYGFVLARLGGDENAAEDLLQDTLLEGFRSRASFRGEAALSTWLCAIARCRLARHYEAERRQELARSGLRPLESPSVEEDFNRRDEVMSALGRLPALHRQVLVFKYLDGLAVGEIAASIGRSRVQTQSLLQRARDGLRRELSGASGG